MKTLFQISNSSRAYAWLLGFALARTILDFFWIPIYVRFIYKLASLFNTTVYLFTLYLFVPAMAGYVLKRVFSRQVNDNAILQGSVLIWIVYPMVTVISLIAKSPPTQTIEWFRYIPTFMVEHNFLPAGMVAVIPILLVFYTRLMVRHSNASWLQAFSSVLLSLWVIYLLYYQWTLSLFYYVIRHYGFVFGFGYATLTYLIPLFPLAGRFHEAFGDHRVMLPRPVLVCTLMSVGLMAVGLLMALSST